MTTRFREAYHAAALHLMNFCVLFAVVNVLLGYGLTAWERRHPEQVAEAGHLPEARSDVGRPRATALRSAIQLATVDMAGYGDLPLEQVEKMLDDFTLWERGGFPYQPWVGFSDSPYQGQYLHVDANIPKHVPRYESGPVNNSPPEGTEEFYTRRSDLSPAPTSGEPADVYVFGGSTALGLYVADAWTVPSNLGNELQRKLQRPVRIFNYGRRYYYSSQEVVLLQRLLKVGRRPAAVVFLDGLNDCSHFVGDVPPFTDRMTSLSQSGQIAPKDLEAFKWLPMVRLAYLWRKRIDLSRKPPAVTETPPEDESVEHVLTLYRDNRRIAKAVCQAYGVPCFFFWQPVPIYHYDQKLSRVPIPLDALIIRIFERIFDTMRDDPETTFLGDAFQEYGADKKALIDQVHYGPAFSKYLAARMAAAISF